MRIAMNDLKTAKTPEQEASDKKIVDKLEIEEEALTKEIGKLKDKLRNMELRLKHIGTEIRKRSTMRELDDPGYVVRIKDKNGREQQRMTGVEFRKALGRASISDLDSVIAKFNRENENGMRAELVRK
jgi:hypothetical protein